ncbi:MAG: ABC transporter permease [Burkholderiales bacterium]|nr:ABC transporter permease [Anaerolineae bacterium]
MQTDARSPVSANLDAPQSSTTTLVNWLLRTQEGILFIILVVLCVVLTFASPVFLTGRNVGVLLSQVSMTAITAMGMTLLITAGEVDLSVGSMQAFIGVVVMSVINQTQDLFTGIIVGLALGALIATVSAIATLWLRINSLIATLAMLSIVRGLSYAFTSAAVQNRTTLPAFAAIGNGFIGPIPWPVAIFAAVFVIFYLIFSRTTFGRYVQAVGGNKRAAAMAGIRVNMVKWACFVITGMLASVSAIILLSRLNSGQNNAGFGFELEVIGAVLLGGTSLQGGRGSLIGTLFAVLLLGVLNNGIILLDINSSWQVAVNGLIILLAVFLDARRRRSVGED